MPLFGNGAIGTGIVINLYDNFSRSADQIRDKFRTLEGAAENAAEQIEMSLNRMKLGFASIALGGLLLAPLIAGAQTSIRLEEHLADVRKTTGLAADEALRLKDNLFELDTRTSIDDLLGIAGIGGQIGIAKKDIEAFTGSVDKVTVALGDEFAGGVEEVSTTLGTLRNTFNDIRSDDVAADMLHIGNALNELGAAGFATAPIVSDFANRIGGIGIPLGLSTGEVLGLSASLQELGINAERGGTAVGRVLQRMLQDTQGFANFAEVSVSEFERVISSNKPGEGLYGAFQLVLKASQGFKGDAVGLAKALDNLKIDGAGASEVFLKLGGRLDLLNDKTLLANTALNETGSILGEFGIKNETTAAMIEKMQKQFVKISDALGQVFLPMVQPLITLVSKLAGAFAWFAKTAIGRVFIQLAAAVGMLAVAIGTAIVVMNVKRWVVGQLAQSLLALGKTELATTFLTKGLAAGFRQATVALIPLSAAMWPIVLIGAALAAGIYVVTKSMDAFKDVLEGTAQPAKGIMGVLQKLGGVIAGIGEIWSSATLEGFSMSEKTAKALEKLGIYEFVVNLGTWLVRLKAFFSGVWEGISTVFSAVGKVVNYLWEGLVKLADAFGIDISKNLSDINKWVEAGKILGYVLAFTLITAVVPMIVGMLSLAVAVIAATWPLLLIIGIIYAVYYAFTHWGEIVEWFSGLWSDFASSAVDAFSDVWAYISSFFDWFMGLPSAFINWGSAVVDAIYEGIMGSWDWLASELTGLIEWLPGGGLILDAFGVERSGNGFDDMVGLTGNGNVVTPEAAANGDSRVNPYLAAASGGTSTNTYERSETVGEFKLYVDGKELKTKLDKIDRTQDNRK